ncbi:MAG: acetyl-CoA C-acyltransferase [Myxococcota bacterium]
MDAFLVDVVRTGRGKGRPGGALSKHRPVELLAWLIEALRERWGPLDADDLVVGCVGQVGDQGSNLARLAALWAGEDQLPGQTLNRFCASGLDAIVAAATRVAAGEGAVLAGGVEMPSRVPMFADRGAWFDDADVARRTRFMHMGASADLLAHDHQIDRDALEAWALRSQQRAAEASFASIVDVDGFASEETIRPETTRETLAQLPTTYGELLKREVARVGDVEPRHTRGTSPALADGAAVALIANEATCRARGWTPRAQLDGFGSVGVDPVRMLHGNPAAIRKALKRAGKTIGAMHAVEINESFAVVPVLAQRELDLDDEILNAWGGAIALGHPLGATGVILTATLLERLETQGKTQGAVSICGGAGLATAVIWTR